MKSMDAPSKVGGPKGTANTASATTAEKPDPTSKASFAAKLGANPRAVAPKTPSAKETIEAAIENALGPTDDQMREVMDATALNLVRSILQGPKPRPTTIDRGDPPSMDDE